MSEADFKRRWKKDGPALPKAPQDLSVRVWARTRARAWWQNPWVLSPSLGLLLLLLGYGLGLRQSAGVTEVHFRLNAPRATQVALRGSFNGWQRQAMHRDGDEWALDLKLQPGDHRYVFVLNGKRSLPDPNAQDAELSPDGEAQSVLYLPKARTL